MNVPSPVLPHRTVSSALASRLRRGLRLTAVLISVSVLAACADDGTPRDGASPEAGADSGSGNDSSTATAGATSAATGSGGGGGEAPADDDPTAICKQVDWSAGCLERDYAINDAADVEDLRTYRCVKGTLDIQLPDVTELDLPNLQFVGGHVHVTTGASNLQGLPALTCVGEDLEIVDSPNLTELDLPSLLSVDGALRIQRNDALTEVRGFVSLAALGGQLQLDHNPALVALDAFPRLRSIGKGLYVDSPLLQSIQGFEMLTEIGGLLFVSDSWDTWPAPASEGGLSLGGDALEDLAGLRHVERIGGNLSIRGKALVSLSGLESLVEVGANLSVSAPLLESLEGLHALTRVGGGVSLSGNDTLTSLSGLENLGSIGTDLSSCCGLIAHGDLTVSSNASLASLDGLSGLKSINADLDISDNPALQNIDALGNLASIGFDVTIESNEQLQSLDGLAHLSSIKNITINDNPELGQCKVCDFRYQFLNYSGEFSATGNAQDACDEDCSGGE